MSVVVYKTDYIQVLIAGSPMPPIIIDDWSNLTTYIRNSDRFYAIHAEGDGWLLAQRQVRLGFISLVMFIKKERTNVI